MLFFLSVSVVQTATVIQYNANVQPVAIASVDTPGGLNVWVSGWGGTALTGGKFALLLADS